MKSFAAYLRILLTSCLLAFCNVASAEAQVWQYTLLDGRAPAAVVTVSSGRNTFFFALACYSTSSNEKYLGVAVRASEHVGRPRVPVLFMFSDQGWQQQINLVSNQTNQGIFVSQLPTRGINELLRELRSRQSVTVSVGYLLNRDDLFLKVPDRFEFRLPLQGATSSINRVDSECRR
jgi:hypothetical protein